ncbi:hypothetical protein [Sphaerotilus sp.]|uniref:hypothetical protein n=1 Tax=Sphaerotilus sp. TaxID=2093942 RepID=UPI002ACDF358|nr:hypothetical protein [Sphaerotilus sp.]MDZ7855895.1 hypothetical protein [Sphaerotilus sp.]
MPDDTATTSTRARINADGLTYHHKPGGSPFSRGSGLHGQPMSCFLCGRHRPRSMLRSRSLLGKSHCVCAPSCNAVAANLEAPA